MIRTSAGGCVGCWTNAVAIVLRTLVGWMCPILCRSFYCPATTPTSGLLSGLAPFFGFLELHFDIVFFIDYEESSYIGSLTVDSHVFCTQIVRFLQEHCYNRPIAEIGGLDITHKIPSSQRLRDQGFPASIHFFEIISPAFSA